MKINNKLWIIADASPFKKIQAITDYIEDLSEFNLESIKLDAMKQYSLDEAAAEKMAVDLCQENLWADFRAALRGSSYYWSLVCMKHQMKNETPEFHKEAYKAMDDDDIRFKCFVRYRGSAKTAQKTNKILQWVTEVMEPVIVMVSSAVALASNEIIDIRAEIESNDIIKYIYGDLKGLDIWNTKALEFANGVYVVAKGTTSQIRGTKWKGQRPTAVLMDDFEDEKNADTEDKRASLKRWFSAQIMPIGDVGFKVLMFGTIVHPDAYLANADPKWNAATRKYDNPNSMFVSPNGYYSRVDIADEHGTPTWPNRYDKDWIESERSHHQAENTLAFFYQEYFNIPAQESNPIIDVKLITEMNATYHDQYGVRYLNVYDPDDIARVNIVKKIPVNVFVGVDPTRGAKASSDDFGMAAIAVTNNNNIIILDMFARVIPISEQAETVVEFVTKWNPTHFTIETYGYQLALAVYVDKLFQERGEHNHVMFEFNENKSKKTKYKESLCNPIANGCVARIKECSNYSKFENQAAKFSGGETEKDDMLDALTLCMHEDKPAGKVLWGPGYEDVDAELAKAKLRARNKAAGNKRNNDFMGR